MEEQYIKMCDCPEIQDGWEPKVWDRTDKGVITRVTTPGLMIEINGYGWPSKLYKKTDLVFCPIQEQLQGMVGPIFWKVVPTYPQVLDEMYDAFSVFIFEGKTNTQWPYNHKVTNQELWLAFVMHELHNKKRDGEKWTKN